MSGAAPFELEFEPRLVEEAVGHAVRLRPSPAYWSSREAVYAIADEAERERAFAALNRSTFEALALAAPFREALAEQPALAERVGRSCVLAAPSGRAEGAELFVRRDAAGEAASRSLVVRVRPASLLHPAELLAFLRHELFHIADMLDPAFGYDPVLPEAGADPARLNLVLERYRVLWDTSIDGRLWRKGLAAPAARALRAREFGAAFAALGSRREEVFRRWFEEVLPSHAAILRLALEPRAAAQELSEPEAPRQLCPLCRCAARLDPALAEGLPPETLAEIHRDFPAWRSAAGICPQCADLYRARPLSRAALAALPAGAAKSG